MSPNEWFEHKRKAMASTLRNHFRPLTWKWGSASHRMNNNNNHKNTYNPRISHIAYSMCLVLWCSEMIIMLAVGSGESGDGIPNLKIKKTDEISCGIERKIKLNFVWLWELVTCTPIFASDLYIYGCDIDFWFVIWFVLYEWLFSNHFASMFWFRWRKTNW